MPVNRGRHLAAAILASARRAGQGPGSRLPTERQLAADLGTTRTAVRHALAALEAEGHISREVGRGTFLQESHWGQADGVPATAPDVPASRATLTADGNGPSVEGAAGFGFAPADVMTVRRLLEPPAMRLVVAWARASDFVEMDRCLAGGAQAGGYEEFEHWDRALHRGIMAASHSPLLTRLYAAVDEARHGHVWGDLKRRTTSRQRQREYQIDHEELVSALRARDAERAVEAMRTHLSRIASYLFEDTQ